VPARLIREGILTSERVDLLDAPAEVFYRRLMSKVDDHGLFDARPSILRSSLYPLRVDRVREADISRWIAACEKAGLIALYEHAGKPYLQMLDTRWTARSEPKYPLPSTENTCFQPQTPVPVFGDVVVDEDDKSPRKRVPPPNGVSDSVWKDFRQLRKAKRAPITDTAIEGIRREAQKAGIDLEAALRMCCERGWQGFKAEWLADVKSAPASRHTDSAEETRRMLDEQRQGTKGMPAELRGVVAQLTGRKVA
jgi:hypothetical protein